jgi:hypothetical protein
VQYQLKTPYRDGTTHFFFEPLDFIARLAALAPKPRVNLTRFHGVFAPNSHLRAQVVPGRRNGNKAKAPDAQDPAPAERRASMTWAQCLKRVFQIDIETCSHCGRAVKSIACIEDSVVVQTTARMQEVEQRLEQLPKILDHLAAKASAADTKRPESRAPPQAVLFR